MFAGRATRSEFWWFLFFALALVSGAWQIDKLLFGHQVTQLIISDRDPSDGVHTVTRIPYDGVVWLGRLRLVAMLVVAFPLASVARRRLRDAGHGATWLVRLTVLVLVPGALGFIPNWPGAFGPAGFFIWPILSVSYAVIFLGTVLILSVKLLAPSAKA
ncbi:DUF805 domain-containing protein [Shimia sp. CNT1-13L.2]|uniref:DUF805 domain-containing protein n=1 Tax=Shimia sp. CNT1-13L.2 TaxID=2959663 RepID=UPI0034E95389